MPKIGFPDSTQCVLCFIFVNNIDWYSRNVMFQAINSHLSMAIVQYPNHHAPVQIYDSFFWCYFEHKGHCTINLHPASSIRCEGYRKNGLDVHTLVLCHACSLAWKWVTNWWEWDSGAFCVKVLRGLQTKPWPTEETHRCNSGVWISV